MVFAVSGSEGFVGKHVCSLLEEESHTVMRIDLSNGLDMCDPSIIDVVNQFDCFIHLANLVYVPASYEDPARFYRVNYLSTLNALELCRKYKAHLVYISSYIYGAPQFLPVNENHPVCPFNPYAQTKVICEKLCEGYHRDFGIKISIVRPFNLYGVGQTGKLLIPEIFSQLKTGAKQIHLKAASPRRDYVNVRDLARAIVACSNDQSSYEVYNVCSGESVSVKEITQIINKHLKNKVDFSFSDSDRPNEVDETRGSYDRLRLLLGWKPSMTFEEGIKEIIDSEGL